MNAIYSGTDQAKAYSVASDAEKKGKIVEIKKYKMGRGAKSYMVYHVYATHYAVGVLS